MLGAAVGIVVSTHYVHSVNQADWMVLSYLLFGVVIGNLVGWIVGMGFKCDDKNACCDKR
ncbi:MAG: hypothetical protein EBX40_03280 [Gammaproteobacteria bacterium]|nr:hypothetical protein [Gammaproteobacteria bacterium]